MLNTLWRRKQQDRWMVTTPQQVREQLEAGEDIIVLDVRSPQEFAQDGHIVGVRLLPLATVAARSSELPLDRPIICVCRSGGRSRTACELLAKQGFTNLHNMKGGMMAWKRAGLPTN